MEHGFSRRVDSLRQALLVFTMVGTMGPAEGGALSPADRDAAELGFPCHRVSPRCTVNSPACRVMIFFFGVGDSPEGAGAAEGAVTPLSGEKFRRRPGQVTRPAQSAST
jgi:hypothetical protein